MLHIVLFVLKIIGIILVILTTLCVLTLVIPCTYIGKGEFKEENRATLVARGFLSLVHFKFSSLGLDMRYVLRILGIPIIRGTIDMDEDLYDDTNANFFNKEKDEGINKEKKVNAKNDAVIISKYAGIMEIREVDDEISNDSENERYAFGIFSNKVRSILSKIKKFPMHIISVKQKYSELKSFFKSKKTKIAFYYAKNIMQKVYNHIKPEKLEAKLVFGFDSPDKTGQALGILGLIYGTINIDKDKIQIIPDFEKRILEGTVYMKGHFVSGYIILQLFKLYFKKEVHDIIEKVNIKK